MDYVNLHRHDEFSLLDGSGTPTQSVQVAKDLGQTALSQSNHGNLIGSPHHIKACLDGGIKPIVAMEAYFKPDRTKKDNEHKKQWHLLLIAKNEAGWKNLIKLTTEANLTGFYYKPVVDYELLEKYSEGIICSTACVSGYIPWHIQQNEYNKVHNEIERHLDIFGSDFYFEIMPHDLPAQRQVNQALAKLSVDYSVPLLATNDSHMPYKSWQDTQDVLLMIATNQTTEKRKAKKEAGEDVYEMKDIETLYMMSKEDMVESFIKYHPDLTKQSIIDSVEESGRVSDKIEPFELDKSNKFPKNIAKDGNPFKQLSDWCNEGLERIEKKGDKVYEDRLAFELETMKNLDVLDYFLLVGDIVRWARSKHIRISSGRGSAAGSLVCYLTQITTIDPIGHKLLFERFMNPDRKGLPDIDLDFQDERRDEVKEYAAEKYGKDKVANLLALGTFKPKSALKDVSRVLCIPYNEVNNVTSLIPDPPNQPDLQTCRETIPEVKVFAEKYPEVWKHASRIEGQTKQLSQHAAGVIITDKPVTEYMPLMRGSGENIVTAWSDRADAPIVSELGFPKIDLLSINGLTKQGKAIEMIHKTTGKLINLDDLPVAKDPNDTDPEVFKLLQKGQCLGIWQFNSKGASNFLKKIKPNRFQDLSAANALYRPGPLTGGEAFEYADRKNGVIDFSYWDQSVEPALSETYGIVCYQEQMMEVVKQLGNFSPSQADFMRKAASKLYRVSTAVAQEAMSEFKEQWDKGIEENGIDKAVGDDIWERVILAFGGYSFNKSHASSYGLISYQDAFLKTYYLLPFYASLLSEDNDRANEIIREARSFDVIVGPPDINKSSEDFTITEDGELLYGLSAVTYVGDQAVSEIDKLRPIESSEDLYNRAKKQKVNKRVIENLILGGAFDFCGERDHMSNSEKREAEKKALGVSISGSGASNKYAKIIEERISTEEEVESLIEGEGVTIGGEITNVKEITTRGGKPMCFVSVNYKENVYDITFFTQKFYEYEELLKESEVVMIRGRKSDRGNILCDVMIRVEDLAKELENG